MFDKEDGYPLSDNPQLYKIAGGLEMPEMVSIIDDLEERAGRKVAWPRP